MIGLRSRKCNDRPQHSRRRPQTERSGASLPRGWGLVRRTPFNWRYFGLASLAQVVRVWATARQIIGLEAHGLLRGNGPFCGVRCAGVTASADATGCVAAENSAALSDAQAQGLQQFLVVMLRDLDARVLAAATCFSVVSG